MNEQPRGNRTEPTTVTSTAQLTGTERRAVAEVTDQNTRTLSIPFGGSKTLHPSHGTASLIALGARSPFYF